MISQEEATQTNEKVILTNERGVTVQFHIGGVAEGNLGVGSATDMLRVEVSKAADSSFCLDMYKQLTIQIWEHLW